MILCAIDPGASGAFVWRQSDGEVCVGKMPKTIRDIWDLVEDLKSRGPVSFLMEKVGTYMPGNSGPASAKFAEHVGCLKMALTASKQPFDLVTPAKWEHAFIGKPDYPKLPKDMDKARRRVILGERKRDRKNKIKARAQMLFPEHTITLWNADAFGMLWYFENVVKGGIAPSVGGIDAG